MIKGLFLWDDKQSYQTTVDYSAVVKYSVDTIFTPEHWFDRKTYFIQRVQSFGDMAMSENKIDAGRACKSVDCQQIIQVVTLRKAFICLVSVFCDHRYIVLRPQIINWSALALGLTVTVRRIRVYDSFWRYLIKSRISIYLETTSESALSMISKSFCEWNDLFR